MTLKPLILASALTLAGMVPALAAEPPVSAVDLTAAAALLPTAAVAATGQRPQRLDDVDVEPEAVPELTPAQRRAANRKAREELRRRFGPSIHIFN